MPIPQEKITLVGWAEEPVPSTIDEKDFCKRSFERETSPKYALLKLWVSPEWETKPGQPPNQTPKDLTTRHPRTTMVLMAIAYPILVCCHFDLLAVSFVPDFDS